MVDIYGIQGFVPVSHIINVRRQDNALRKKSWDTTARFWNRKGKELHLKIIEIEDVREIRLRLFFAKSKANQTQRVTLSSIYRIIPAEGKPCTISADPGPAIELAVTACQLPHALENYAAGNLLSFGWLELNLEGLHLRPGMPAGGDLTTQTKRSGTFSSPHKLLGACIESGERFLAWEYLACAWIDESRSTLVLSKKGVRQHWAIVPLYQVPNSALCLALIEHASGHTA